jgi:hypothetical protein
LIVSGSASARNSARKPDPPPEPFCLVSTLRRASILGIVLGRLNIAFGHLARPTQLLVTNPRRML